MAADKYNCPICNLLTVVVNTSTSNHRVTRYRHCRICRVNFQTVEQPTDTPRMRQILGPDKSLKLWGKPPFKYKKLPDALK